MKNIRFFLLAALASMISLQALADHEETIKVLSGAHVHVGTDGKITVRDDKWRSPLWDSIEINQAVNDVVVFEVNDDTTIVSKVPFTATITLKIESWDKDSVKTTVTKDFTIKYDTGKVKLYGARYVYTFTGAHKMRITVMGLTTTPSIIPNVLHVKGEILIDRKYKFNCAQHVYPKGTVNTSTNAISVTWNTINGAEEYDFEWTYYHDSSDVIKHYLANPSTPYSNYDSLYRNNATRVTVLQNHYSIPMIYPQGYVFFRVRAVHYTVDSFRKVNTWSANDTSTVFTGFHAKAHVNNFDSLLNWQWKMTYAEQGKRTPVINYFDGTMRSRQNESFSDANNQVIIGETFYDHQGRPAVQTLPVPIDDYKLGFHNLYNKINGTSDEYNRDTFDIYGCGFSPPPIDSAALSGTKGGSSFYYSCNDPLKTLAMHQYIPTANGYAFTAMRYTPDLTGRIALQGGAGKDLRLGGGHETKYYYGKPSQEELDKLFGNDVGVKSHYFENMVVDPNGQVSLSYLDMSGHTIATALAGETPGNLSALPSNTGDSTITINLLDSATAGTNYLTSTYALLVEQAGTHSFTYSLLPGDFSLGCTNDPDICFDCLYDLEITITDVCDNANLPGDTAFKLAEHNYSIAAIYDTLCANPSADINESFDLNLPVGEYHITKTLTVSDAAKDQYLTSYFVHDTCLKSYDDFLTEATSEMDFAGCYIDCQDCRDHIGNEDTFIHHYLTDLTYTPTAADSAQAITLWNNALASCDELCDTVSNECEQFYKALVIDVSPGGQYCDYHYDSGSDQYIADEISVLNHATSDTYFGGLDYTNLTYYKADGVTPDTVWINGSPYFPSAISVDQFIHYWQPSWAAALVTLHPEYCFYDWCSAHMDVYDYAARMLNTSSFAAADDSGYLDPLGLTPTYQATGLINGTTNEETFNTNAGDLDPFFAGFGSSFFLNIADSMHHIGGSSYTYWQVASWSANCQGQCSPIPWFTDSCDANADRAWWAFRGVYLGSRKRFLDAKFFLDQPDCFTVIDSIGESGRYSEMVRHFEILDSFAVDTTEAGVEDSIISTCQNTCEAMADGWMTVLMAHCSLSPTDSANIRAGLIEVCQTGCDGTHAFGASTLPDGVTSPSGYASFQDVLDSILGLSLTDTLCNAMSIDFPPPYSQSLPIQQTFIGDYDTCVCHHWNMIHNLEYLPDSTPGSTFTHYLADHYNSDLTEDQVNEVLSICNGTCSWMNEPIALPAGLGCNECTTCQDLLSEYGAVQIDFGGESLVYNTDDSSLFASYLNDYFSTNYSFKQFDDWADTCRVKITSPAPNPGYIIFCDTSGTILTDTVSCFDALMNLAQANATLAYQSYVDSLDNSIWADYVQHCLESAEESFTVDKLYNQYHFTLYFYDQAGNLEATIPPAGVHPLYNNQLDDVEDYRAGIGSPLYPSHTMVTHYWYNTLNSPIKQFMPDTDSSFFWYDRLGRIVVSQNARQFTNNQYSYIRYDNLSRIIEVGQLVQSHTMKFDTALNDVTLAKWIKNGTTKKEVTRTFYDKATFSVTGLTQSNLRNRVASTIFQQSYNSDSSVFNFATHYSYDIAGNVKTLVQDNEKLSAIHKNLKHIDYNYDLVSGKVNKVLYEKDSTDQFFQWYVYNDDNKLVTMYSTFNGLLWERDANYLYYNHGPLGRLEIGQRQVQGVDYAYTVQGWLKGVNAAQLNKDIDMGRDGKSTAHKVFALDAYGFLLDYFNKDYKQIGSTYLEPGYNSSSHFFAGSSSLFNGNICRATYALRGLSDTTIGYAYHYDQLNRLTGMNAYDGFDYTNYLWPSTDVGLNKWKEISTYDENGNIKTYIRHGSSPSPMDSLTYHYTFGKNQLTYLDDISSTYTADVIVQAPGNYDYDATGNLVHDSAEHIKVIWTVAGKVDSIGRTGGTSDKLKFYYDATGNRVGKIDYKNSGAVIKWWYVRDAQGNILATYKQTKVSGNDTLRWSEQDIYGNSRLGYWQPNKRLYPTLTTTGDTFHVYAGDKRYELTNHLGNIMAVVTDRKLFTANGSNVVTQFKPDVASIQDYYPFGMLMPGRNFSSNTYDFGFNGKLNDNEVHGVTGGWQDYGMRMYDPRVGRFPSVDPLTKQYPWYTPYQFAGDGPVANIDLDGLEPVSPIPLLFKSIGVNNENDLNTIVTSVAINDAKNTAITLAMLIPVEDFVALGVDLAVEASWARMFGSQAKLFATEVRVLDQGASLFKEEAPTPSDIMSTDFSKVTTSNVTSNTIKDAKSVTIRSGGETKIFTSAHNFPNTSKNRELIIDLVKNNKAIGYDEYGSLWYSREMEDKTQLWATARNNEIFEGGINLKYRDLVKEKNLKPIEDLTDK